MRLGKIYGPNIFQQVRCQPNNSQKESALFQKKICSTSQSHICRTICLVSNDKHDLRGRWTFSKIFPKRKSSQSQNRKAYQIILPDCTPLCSFGESGQYPNSFDQLRYKEWSIFLSKYSVSTRLASTGSQLTSRRTMPGSYGIFCCLMDLLDSSWFILFNFPFGESLPSFGIHLC